MIVNSFIRYLSNFPGWSTGRNLLVIESDDWGSIRMPSKNVFSKLASYGMMGLKADRYNKYDSLATADDIESLFNILDKHRDCNGKSSAFTAMSLVANPDFDKIREEQFCTYYHEPFTDTLKKYYGNNNPFNLWIEGIEKQLFVPQFHGREHLNVAEWMRQLRAGDKFTHLAFDHGLWGFKRNIQKGQSVQYQAAFDLVEADDLIVQQEAILEGLNMFEKLFGYSATNFVPPNGPFNNSLEKTAADGGIKYMSASKIQNEPLGYGKTKRVFHKLGQINAHDQIYITRNCFFEPNQGGKDWVDTCLAEIEIAFRMRKPAVISSHRTNYIGVHDKSNRDRSLTMLNTLLTTITKKWPAVEFITSSQLGDIIVQSIKSPKSVKI